MPKRTDRNADRAKRHLHIRRSLTGTSEKSRLCVFKSSTNIYAQLIDGVNHNILIATSTLDKDFNGESKSGEGVVRFVGESAGKRAIDRGARQYVFNKSEYLCHGKVKELAEGTRSAELKF